MWNTGLHAALVHVGVSHNDIVITQPLTFVATCNAIHQAGAEPVFVDVCNKTLGMDQMHLNIFLKIMLSLRKQNAFSKKQDKK